MWYTCEVEESWPRARDDEDDGQIRDLLLVKSDISMNRHMPTISPNRAIAGKSVGVASLWWSIPSKMRTNFFCP